MADNKKMTRFEFALWAKAEADKTEDAAIIAAADAFVTSENKKRERAKNAPTSESKEKRLNRAKCEEIMRAIVDAGNEPRNADWIGTHVPMVETSHKVTGKMNIGRSLGWVAYGDNVDKRRAWIVTPGGIAHLESLTTE